MDVDQYLNLKQASQEGQKWRKEEEEESQIIHTHTLIHIIFEDD